MSENKKGILFVVAIVVLAGAYVLWSNVRTPSPGRSQVKGFRCAVDVGVLLHDDVYFSRDPGYGDTDIESTKALTNIRVSMKLWADDGKHFERECYWQKVGYSGEVKEEFNAVFNPWHAPDHVSLIGTCDQGKINLLWENPKRNNSGNYDYQLK